MEIDFSTLGFGPTISSAYSGGSSTSVGNISPTFDSIEALYGESTPRNINLSTQPTVEGYPAARRGAFGQLYPRGMSVGRV
jgi:hypothetical protein